MRSYRLFMNSGQWKRIRQQYRGAHPLCERCLAQGRTTLATETHHRVNCGNDPDLQTAWGNLEALCSPCHAEHHAPEKAEQRGGYSKVIDSEGYPISPSHPANRRR